MNPSQAAQSILPLAALAVPELVIPALGVAAAGTFLYQNRDALKAAAEEVHRSVRGILDSMKVESGDTNVGATAANSGGTKQILPARKARGSGNRRPVRGRLSMPDAARFFGKPLPPAPRHDGPSFPPKPRGHR